MISVGARKRLESDWAEYAGAPVEVEYVKGTFYGYGSELAVLRIFAKYNANGAAYCKTARVGYSDNLKTHYFALETSL